MDLSGNQGDLPIPMQAPASPNASGLVLLPSPPAAVTEELGNNNNGNEALVLLPSPPAAEMEEEHGNNKNGNEAAPVLLPSPPAAATEEEQGNNSNGNEAPVLLPSPPAAAATEEEESSGLKKPAAVSVTGAIGTGAGPVVKYRECLKNHAAAMGGNATDGCGEFMPSGEEGSLEALKCAACGCHCNFHRKEVDDDAVNVVDAGHGNGGSYGHRLTDPYAAMHAPPPLHHHQLVNAVPLSAVHTAEPGARGSASSMKRFRTKFSAEQKARMLAFAERAGWRLTNVDEGAVQAFCQEIGVRRPVLKVWMHNNKYTLRSKRLQAPPVPAAAASPPPPPLPQMLMPMVPPPPPPSSPQHEGLAFVHLGGPSSPPPPQQMMMPMAPPFRRSPGSPPLKLN